MVKTGVLASWAQKTNLYIHNNVYNNTHILTSTSIIIIIQQAIAIMNQGRLRFWGRTTKKIHFKTSQNSLHNDMAGLVR